MDKQKFYGMACPFDKKSFKVKSTQMYTIERIKIYGYKRKNLMYGETLKYLFIIKE